MKDHALFLIIIISLLVVAFSQGMLFRWKTFIVAFLASLSSTIVYNHMGMKSYLDE